MQPTEQVACVALIVIVFLSASLCADDVADWLAARRARKQAPKIDDEQQLP